MEPLEVPINSSADIVVARRTGRDMARNLGFGVAAQTRLATAISELTRNVVVYAGSGVCHITGESNGTGPWLRITIEDHGPGISDIEQALSEGFSTGGSLGAGLPGTKRLVDEFVIESEPGHTKISILIGGRRP